MNRFYIFIRTIFWPLIKLLFPFEASGLENLPKEGAVLCANHASGWDPILICMALPRKYPIRMMAKTELLHMPVLGWLIRKLGGFAVDRGHSDTQAVRTAIKTIRDGGNLLIFPEGTRVMFEGQVRAKGGVVMIAMRTGASMVPVNVGGKKRLFQKTKIIFGAPYRPETGAKRGTAEEYQTYADEILHRAYELGAGK